MVARTSLVLVGAAVAGLALSGCGAASSGDAPSAASTVSGLVSSEVTASSVSLRDASDPTAVHTISPGADGSFSFDASGLTPPFVVRADVGQEALYTIVLHSGNADVNGLTTVAVAGAMSDGNPGTAWSHWSERGAGGDDGEHDGAERIGSVIRTLRTVLKPLFDLYQVGRIGGDDDEGDVSGMRALLRDVSFTVSNGVVTVTNRATGGVIFTAPLNDLASGVFHPENMPAGPGGTPPPPPATCTGFTYTAWTPATCPASGQQTRTVVSTTPAGCTGGSPVLTQTCTLPPPPPATCTGFTYSAWTPATCPASGQQTRTVVSATPAGCTGGNPVLTQTCTPPPPPPATCTSFTYTAWTPATCPASGQQTRTVASATPAGCTGGNPVLTQTCTPPPPPPATCTGFTYSAWTPATCPASGQQTRTVVSATPAGCTGGNPVLTQTCTPPPPPPVTCTSFTYTAWAPATCPASGQQTRTVATASPAGCTGGTPVLTQTCTYVPPPDGAALYQQSCAGCHGALASSNLKGKNISVASIKSFNMTQGLTDAQLQAIVTAVGP